MAVAACLCLPACKAGGRLCAARVDVPADSQLAAGCPALRTVLPPHPAKSMEGGFALHAAMSCVRWGLCESLGVLSNADLLQTAVLVFVALLATTMSTAAVDSFQVRCIASCCTLLRLASRWPACPAVTCPARSCATLSP